MRLRIHVHHHFEGPLALASADFQAQLTRLSTALSTSEAALSTANSTVTSLSTALDGATASTSAAVSTATVAADEADVADLKSTLDAGGVPA